MTDYVLEYEVRTPERAGHTSGRTKPLPKDKIQKRIAELQTVREPQVVSYKVFKQENVTQEFV